MNDYVYLVSDRYQLFIKAEAVLEIVLSNGEEVEINGHQNWRGKIIPIVSMRKLLGVESGSKAEQMGIVFRSKKEREPVYV